MTLLLLALVLTVDLLINWYLENKRNIRPNHFINWGIRAALGALIAYHDKGSDVNWLLKGLSYIPIYWWVFDYGLNLLRGKPLMYLGDSVMDKLEVKYLQGWYPAFCMKSIIFIFCMLLVIFNYDPNPW